MPVSRCPIPLGVQTPHIFRQEISIHSKIDLYVEGSCAYRFVLFVNFYITRYKDIALQSRNIFPARFAPFYGQRQHEYSTLPVDNLAYKTLLRDGVAHRSLICCTAYGKLRLSTFFDVGTDKAAWRRITRVETSRLVNLVATVRPVRYSGRGRGRRAWLRALMLMTMVIMAISIVMIDDNDVDNKFDDDESKVK